MKLVWLKIAVVLLALSGCSPTFAQCGPILPGGTVCGNDGTAQGLNEPLTAPVLGIPGTSTGQLGLAGSSSGAATIVPQAATGSPTLTLPNTSGTLPSTAASPIVLNATTGQLSCPTCFTGSGGALTATSPLFLTSGVLSLQGATGTIAIGSGGTGSAFSATPTLGVSGSTLGTLTLSGNTSGTAKLTPQAAAGTNTVLTLPNTSGTLADGASLPLVLSATTGNLTCPTCATSTLNGAALTAANDTNVTLTLGGTPATSLLNAASITAGWTGTLAAGRLNSNVVQSFTNDTNVTASISAQVATLGWAGQLAIGRGGTGAATAAAAISNLMPTPTRAGDIVYWNGSNWVTLAGNNSGTQVLSENSSGVPSWTTAGAATMTSATVTAGTGVNTSGTCTSTTVLNCTVNLTTPVAAANGGAGTINGVLSGNGSGVVSQGATSGLSDVTTPTTWSPSDQSGAGLTFTSVTAIYTRIGKHVVAQFILTFPSTASGATIAIGGLPVAASSSGANFAAGICKTNITSFFIVAASMAANSTQINIYSTNAVAINSTFTTATLSCTVSYISN